MINLLPKTLKSEIRAARINVVLLRYIAIVLLAAGFIFGLLATSYTVLQQTYASAQVQIEANDTKAEVYANTQQQVQQLSAQLNEAKTILQNETRYSKLLVGIGQLMPEGTILESLPITPEFAAGNPTQLKAFAKRSADAVTIQESFKSSPLISQIAIQSTAETGGTSEYPIVISLSVSINPVGAKQ